MTLKQALKIINETQYRIVAHDVKADTYDYLDMNYLRLDDTFSDALKKREGWENIKNKVYCIRYNKAAGMLEIDIEI